MSEVPPDLIKFGSTRQNRDRHSFKMEMAGTTTGFASWVVTILHQGEQDISFDEIYFSCFEAIAEDRTELVVRTIEDSFETIITEFRDELCSQPPDAFNIALKDLCLSVLSSIAQISAAFSPITLVLPRANFSRSLTEIFKQIVFCSVDSTSRFDVFLSTYAHSLPGTNDIESDRSLLELLITFLEGTPRWTAFVDDLVDATDAFCIGITSSALQNESILGNSVLYFGVLLEVLDNEEKLWSILPNSVAARLRRCALDALLSSIVNSSIFKTVPQRDLFARSFFDDMTNWDLLNLVVDRLGESEDFRKALMSVLSEYFTLSLRHLLVQNGILANRTTSLSVVVAIVEFFMDISEKIDLITKLIAREGSAGASIVRDLLRLKSLNIEKALAIEVGRWIDIVNRSWEDCKIEKYRIKMCVNLSKLVPDGKKFVRNHIHQMLLRLFRTGGKYWRFEVGVLESLGIRSSLREIIVEFGSSDAANQRWARIRPDSPLRVFLLPEIKSSGIVPRYGELLLPAAFGIMQERFQAFYRNLMNTKHVRLRWVYEDNLVQVRLVSAAYNILLRLPLIFAVILATIFDYGESSYDFISKKTNLGVQEIEYFVMRCVSKTFPLLVVTSRAIRGGKSVTWNPTFVTKQKKFAIETRCFSLRKPKADSQFQVLSNPVSREAYLTIVTQILKKYRRVETAKLFRLSQQAIQKVCPFRKDEYDRCLIFLQSSGYFEKDPSDPSILVYT
jgi:hypothetical protein